jgi:hypothetical protein
MVSAAILALLLAQGTPPPAPTPSAGRIQAQTLSFADGLRRLIEHGSNLSPHDLVFSQDLGPQVGQTSVDGTEIYALNFTIAGLTGCQVVSTGYDQGYVACTAYVGPDTALARSTFTKVQNQLRTFAGPGASFSVQYVPRSLGLSEGPTTTAEYWPNGLVSVSVNMLEARNGPSGVTLQVTHVPEYQRRPT